MTSEVNPVTVANCNSEVAGSGHKANGSERKMTRNGMENGLENNREVRNGSKTSENVVKMKQSGKLVS